MKARVGLLCIAGYFLYFAFDGLNAYFSGDDAMNLAYLHDVWAIPYLQAVANAFLVFTNAYRPMGGLFYRTLWALFGFHPLPFHAACLLVLTVNLLLAWRLARCLTRSREIGLFTILIFSYHAIFIDLIYNAGTIYDLLCFFFYTIGLAYYVRVRQHGAPFTIAQTAILTACAAAAIESKEMAVTFPLVLVLYEIFFSRGTREIKPIISTGLLVCIYAAINLTVKNEMNANALYQPHFSLTFILRAYCHYYDLVFYAPGFFTIPKLLAFWAVLLAPAALWRNKVLAFGVLFSIVTTVPVAVIAPRAGFVLYLPFFGLALYFAAAIVRLCSAPAAQAVAFAALLVLLGWTHRSHGARAVEAIRQSQETTRNFMTQLAQWHPKLTPGALVLYTDDPFPASEWTLLFLMRLRYDDPAIWVDRPKVIDRSSGTTDLALYDYVFAYKNGRMIEPARQQRTVRLSFSPSRVKRGQPYVVSIPELSGQTVDTAFRIVKDRKSIKRGVMRPWCTLDASGQAHLITPVDQILGTVFVTNVRAATGTWMRAEGSIEVVP